MSTRRTVLSLYRSLLRESEKLSWYNYRQYAVRRIRDAFRANQRTSDFAEIAKQIEFGRKNLEMIRRQAIVGHLYPPGPLISEKPTLKI